MAMHPVKLSVVIITKNEDKNIGRCIKSVQNIADEIVVIDSFSTDKTEEICKKHQVVFIKHAFEGHIEQKNFALTCAKYKHVLSLDADEALSEELQKSIVQAKADFSKDGYFLNRMTNYCGKWIKHSGWYPDRKLRLFDKTKGQWGGENPHDKYELFSNGQSSRLSGDILHYSFYSIDQHLDTIKKFSSISAQTKFDKGKKASLYDLIIRPVWKFKRNYFFKAGFLDGYYGFVICVLSSYATFLRYAKLKQLNKQSLG